MEFHLDSTVEKELNAKIDKMIPPHKDSILNSVYKLSAMTNLGLITEEQSIRILTKLRENQELEREKVSLFEATLDASGNVIPLYNTIETIENEYETVEIIEENSIDGRPSEEYTENILPESK
jgi:hypothetical protein